MIKIITSVLIVFGCAKVSAQFYGNTISVSTEVHNIITPAIVDLTDHLSKATAKNFKVIQSVTPQTLNSITLIIKELRELPELNQQNNPYESFHIHSSTQNLLTITACTPRGLQLGIYTYLDYLGFRWFHAGDVWTHIPKLNSIYWKIDTVISPYFECRNIFGQTGLPRNPYIDKGKTVAKEWITWERRNRLGSYYLLPGHSSFEFIRRNKTIFKEHPEYYSLVNNQRGGTSSNGKFCISNVELQELFIDDMCKQLNILQKNKPNAPRYVISVEPSDGGGHCSCDSCKKMGSVSNRIFFLANETAKAFQKINSNAYVCLYAYNQHANTPTFQLERNVIVQVVPYKFQSVSTPNELIEKWKTTASSLFIRDYYALPVNNMDRPLSLEQGEHAIGRKVKKWHSNGVIGVNVESSYSIPSAGLGLYTLSRMLWDINQNPQTIIDEYYSLNYTSLASDVTRELMLLKQSKPLSDTTINLVATILNQLRQKTSDTLINHKICIHLAYLHYLTLLRNYNEATKETKEDAAYKLLTFVHETFYYNVVHTAPLLNVLARNQQIKKYVQEYWEPKIPKNMPTDKMKANYSNIVVRPLYKIIDKIYPAAAKTRKLK